MCTNIVETAVLTGSAKGANGWFVIDTAAVSYDHPAHARVEHAVMMDFFGSGAGSQRAGLELTLDAARGLADAITAALARARAYEGARAADVI